MIQRIFAQKGPGERLEDQTATVRACLTPIDFTVADAGCCASPAMTTVTSSASAGSEPSTGLPLTSVVAVVIGNWLEFYDFLVFTFFAVMIADAFFPSTSPIVRLLSALATFGVGFVTRPLGAAVIGVYADKVGRRAALTLTLILMAVGSAAVALTPSYSRIGIAAPIILLLARLLQGFSTGGEVGPATTYLLESAPPDKRAALTAWQGYSQQLAILVGSLAGVVLSALLTREQLYAWGWRIPFLLGIVIAPVGLYIRRQLPETLTEHVPHRSGGDVLRVLFRDHWRPVLFGVMIGCGATIATYVFNYTTTYAITTLHLSVFIGTTMSLTGALGQIGGMFTGTLLDRIGRKPTLVGSRVLFALILFPAYVAMIAPGASPTLVVTINVVLNVVFGVGMGGLYAFLTEAFPASVRASGLAILYALATTIFGGTTQFVVAWLIDRTQNPMMPAWYQLATTIVAIAGCVMMRPHRETAGQPG
jgi:MFS family permease